MKKLILLLMLVAIMALTAVRGFQVVNENSAHLMNGEIMTNHEMPAPDCNTDTCLMLAQATLILGAFISTTGVEPIARILLAFAFVSTALLIYTLKSTGNPFTNIRPQKIPIGVESVIFRE